MDNVQTKKKVSNFHASSVIQAVESTHVQHRTTNCIDSKKIRSKFGEKKATHKKESRKEN